MTTKLRALLQRNKGRDLVDLSHALEILPKLKAQRTADMFLQYRTSQSRGGKPRSARSTSLSDAASSPTFIRY